mgnify:CR=1 FL=1
MIILARNFKWDTFAKKKKKKNYDDARTKEEKSNEIRQAFHENSF